MFKKIFLISLILGALLPFVFAHGASGIGDAGNNLTNVGGTTKMPLTKSLEGYTTPLLKTILGLIGTIFFIMMIYAGFLWLTAAGNEEKAGKGKKIIIESVIGIVITLSAYAITAFVAGKLGGGGSATSGGGSALCTKYGGKCSTACESGYNSLVTDDCDKQNLPFCCVKSSESCSTYGACMPKANCKPELDAYDWGQKDCPSDKTCCAVSL